MAGVALLLLVPIAYWGGLRVELVFVATPFCATSMAIWWLCDRQQLRETPYHGQIYPFASFADLSKAYRASGFRKQRYPRDLRLGYERTWFARLIESLLGYPITFIVWLLFTPLVLLTQVLRSDASDEVLVAN